MLEQKHTWLRLTVFWKNGGNSEVYYAFVQTRMRVDITCFVSESIAAYT